MKSVGSTLASPHVDFPPFSCWFDSHKDIVDVSDLHCGLAADVHFVPVLPYCFPANAVYKIQLLRETNTYVKPLEILL